MALNVCNNLIARCKSKDRSAQKELYGQLVPYLNVVCQRYLRDNTYLNDTLQETFILIFTKIDLFNAELASFKTWSVKIAINCCLKHNKKNERHKVYQLEPTKHERSITMNVLDKFTDEEIMKFLKTMPFSYFQTFNLYTIEGFSHKEIAELLQIDESLSRKRLSRAKTWIGKRIESKKFEIWFDRKSNHGT